MAPNPFANVHYPLLRSELRASIGEGNTKLGRLMSVRSLSLSAGETLVHGGEDHEFVYRLRSGWACRSRLLTDGREQTILIFIPGDLFAVKSLFVDRHPDDIRAVSPAVVDVIDRHQLYEAYLRDGDIAARCTWQVVEEERRLHSWVVGLGQGTAEERVARLLIDLRGRLARSGQGIAPDGLDFEMPLKQKDIASHLGLTPIYVNRVLKAIRGDRIATVKSGRVTIHNLGKLVDLARPLLDPYEISAPEYVGVRRAEEEAQTKLVKS